MPAALNPSGVGVVACTTSVDVAVGCGEGVHVGGSPRGVGDARAAAVAALSVAAALGSKRVGVGAIACGWHAVNANKHKTITKIDRMDSTPFAATRYN